MLRLRRRCAQTARISLHVQSVSKSADTKHAAHQNLWRTCRLASRFSELSLRLTVASVRHRHVSASVRRYLRRASGTRKSKKHVCRKNFAETGKLRKIWWLTQETLQLTRHCSNILALAASPAVLRPRLGAADGLAAAAAMPEGQGRGSDR